MRWVRRVLSPYSVNSLALAWSAGGDGGHGVSGLVCRRGTGARTKFRRRSMKWDCGGGRAGRTLCWWMWVQSMRNS